MPSVRRSWTVLLVAVVLAAVAGIASAAEGDPAEDTLVNLGYDEENHLFLFNTSPTNSTYDCTLENGVLATQYGPAVDSDPIPVEKLEVEVESGVFEAFTFLNRRQEEVDIVEFSVATETATYEGAGGACGLSGAIVGGPNGQINHGQFMKLFHQLVDTQGMGCLNRIIANSDFGKGDQQVRTSDVDASFELGQGGTVDFKTAAADCEHGKKDKGEDHPGQGGQQDQSNQSDSPGNSGNAGGHNK